jgi:hypothetical protein
MRTINMRACDALQEGLITETRYRSLIKEHGEKIGRSYPVAVQVDD